MRDATSPGPVLRPGRAAPMPRGDQPRRRRPTQRPDAA